MDTFLDELITSPAVSAAGTALAATGVALWVAAAWWAYRDAGRRTESTLAAYLASAWIVLATPLFLPMALIVYRVARPQVAAAEQRTSALARALSATATFAPTCTGCGAGVDAAWLRCPDCATWLAAPCAACARWSDRAFDLCPWCGADQQGRLEVAAAATLPEVTVPTMTDRAEHGTAAADGVPAAAGLPVLQRAISSARPLAYAASRDASSASS